MVLRDFILFLTFIFTTNSVFSQRSSKKAVKKYASYGNLKVDKSFDKEHLGEFMIPLEQCDDIKNCNIKVKNSKTLKTTMASRPNFFSLLLGKKNRRYVILVNNNTSFDGVKLSNVPKEARIGLFAHELMHIRDYESRRLTGIIERGYQYLSENGKRKVEHFTDSLTIDAGFGEELYHWASYVLYDSKASDEYKTFKSEVYMKPVHILNQMEQEL